MKKVSILICVLLIGAIASAQHYINPFFDGKGSARISSNEYNPDKDTIITTFHRNDDVIWSRYVYRIIDMRQKQNYQLYFPVASNDPDYRSLFLLILHSITNKDMPLKVYKKGDEIGDTKPHFDADPMTGEDLAKALNYDLEGVGSGDVASDENMLIHYDSLTNVMSFSDYRYSMYVRNQIKYLIHEIVFFDRHTSRLHSKIIGIAPLWAEKSNENDDAYTALYKQILFWIPFDELRPYMAQQFIIPSQNETKRVTFDEFFQKRLYSSYLVGEGNMYNRMLTDPNYKYTEKEIKREQARIEKEMLDFEQDLWEY